MTAHGNSRLPWIQPILVAKEGSHADTILAGAFASLGVWLRHPDRSGPEDISAALWSRSTVPASNFDEWLAGPFGKTARRMSMRDLSKLTLWCTENAVPYDSYEIGDSAAVALPPMRYEDLPKMVAKAQVSGTDFRRDGPAAMSASGERALYVTVHVDESLTTGKAVAQAAHALWLWAFGWLASFEDAPASIRHENVAQFLASGPAVQLRLRPREQLVDLDGQPCTASIRDAGLTEVAPHSLTAIADWRA